MVKSRGPAGMRLRYSTHREAQLRNRVLRGMLKSRARSPAPAFRQMRWKRELGRMLAVLGRSVEEAPKEAKAADWKVAIVTHMRRTTTASNPWLAQALAMGAPNALSRYVAECRGGLRPGAASLLRKLKKIKK